MIEGHEALAAALHAEVGVVVSTNDPHRLRAKLYGLRKSEPEYACLSFTISPTAPDDELWILRRPADATPEE